ncbi:catalase-peroxidase [Powellomyces hirtus]|uniref:Peroxidase n=1 Tax=Powellomyces hirtus TaxID=109895 RepID=A0A507E2E0_9FUNG|nr:catalase-peroxidase [Powellomyces hirtus]
MIANTKKMLVAVAAVAVLVSNAFQPVDAVGCPMLARRDVRSSALPPNHPTSDYTFHTRDEPLADALTKKPLDWAAVEADIEKALTDSKSFWPADFGNYGPFLIRLAWHCAGSYRTSDGRGGCDGGRIRFNPELEWEDNANLDKARQLLEPIKKKYGSSLSWSDLITLSGDVAITSMGGPSIGFCGGRKDDVDGTDSLVLGPSAEQIAIAPCPVNGNCSSPLGPTTIGLIYVNPEGPMGVPDPSGSVPDIRSSFGRMGMNDRETVALIGGGHSFGKTHGACPAGAGQCGSGPDKGKGPNTFTSGFEGPWTSRPTEWTNEYFVNLLAYNWTKFTGPGGKNQWKPADTDVLPPSKSAIRMLTADVALLYDPSYRALVKEYARDLPSLERDFGAAWYKLVSRDMGPVSRCRGPRVPPPQPFQNPLPAPPTKLADFRAVRKDVEQYLTTKSSLSEQIPGDGPNGRNYGALFVELAWRCASTFRATDFFGGCNGARIRLNPEKNWPENTGMDKVLHVLSKVKSKYPAGLSWADLIVLAGETALEKAGSNRLSFVGGRVDAKDGSNPEPRTYYLNASVAARDSAKVMGLTATQYVALSARLRSPSQQARLGLGDKTYTSDASRLSSEYFQILLKNKWIPTGVESKSGAKQYKASGKGGDLFVTDADLALIWDPEFRKIAQSFAKDQRKFKAAFADAWSTLMKADLF